MRDRAQKGKADIDKARRQTLDANTKAKELEEAINAMGRKSDLNDRDLLELKKQFEAERRKSMSVEEAIVRLQRDNRAKAN